MSFDLIEPLGNPFTYKFYQKQVKFYGQVEPITIGNVGLYSVTNQDGILRDYFNNNWYDIDFAFPCLKINGRAWMSITPMEVQSMHLPLYYASGDVYTAGLGLGYFPLKAAAKAGFVDKVIVYETEQKIIDWFKAQFAGRKELDKIEIRCGDFIEALRKGEIDSDAFIFNDIYRRMNEDQAIDHFCEFYPTYQGYHFWCMESVILDCIVTHGIHPRIVLPPFSQLIRMWNRTSVAAATGDNSQPAYKRTKLSDLYSPLWCEEDCKKFVEAFI